MSPGSSGIPGLFIVLVVIVAVIIIGRVAWRSSVLRSGGLNPFVAREQLEAKLNQSALLTPPEATKTTEQRLAELDDLHERGVISDAERAAARAKIIAGD